MRPSSTPSSNGWDGGPDVDKVLSARVGKPDSRSIDTYLADGGYASVKKVLSGAMTPEQVLEEVKKANASQASD